MKFFVITKENQDCRIDQLIDDWQSEVNVGNYKFWDNEFINVKDELQFIKQQLIENNLTNTFNSSNVQARFGIPQLIQFCVVLHIHRKKSLLKSNDTIDHLMMCNIPIAHLLFLGSLKDFTDYSDFGTINDIIQSCQEILKQFEFFSRFVIFKSIPLWMECWRNLPKEQRESHDELFFNNKQILSSC